MKLEIECMLRQEGEGAIVNCSSIAGLRGIAGSTVYCATKNAVIGFTKATALEYASRSIRINAIAPGCIETDMLNRVTKGNYGDLTKTVPMGRLGKPMEVAKAVVWLCSQGASFITGHVLVVDGGVDARL
jgi:NAD(P)-dependent dehydrogenase (short-subunit alcohol dehydrogenase family)